MAFASNLSAVWIIIANGFMQNPVGYVIRNGRAELEDFLTVVTNPYAWGQFFHTIASSWDARRVLSARRSAPGVCFAKTEIPVFARVSEDRRASLP